MATKSNGKRRGTQTASVSLREIEDVNPCGEEYIKFLKHRAIHSNPCPDGPYGKHGGHDLTEVDSTYRPVREPKFGPDDRIPLALIFPLSIREDENDGMGWRTKGAFWVGWLMDNMAKLSALTVEYNRILSELQNHAEERAMAMALGCEPPRPPKAKRGNGDE